MRSQPTFAERPIPARAGVGLKPEHYDDILDLSPAVGWFEVHAENYMEAGGVAHHYLAAIRSNYPLSVHGVGMSLGAAAPLDEIHLARLKAVCDRYQPGLVSEHLAWSTHDGVYLNDLLPLPYTWRVLDRVCEHIDRVQTVLKRRILLENPSTYVAFDRCELSELEFIRLAAERTGCGLLLDLNNIFVSANNHFFDPNGYLESFPLKHVEEVHVAGHAEDRDDLGRTLLIDAHGCPVSDAVWKLLRLSVEQIGRKPVLIEWDNDVPDWDRLHAEAMRADAILVGERGSRDQST